MPSDLNDKWRDEDGEPSPAQELTDWWTDEADVRPAEEWTCITVAYRNELYATIRGLRARVAALEAA